MKNIGIDKLMNSTNSIYKLAILAAKRAQELNQGSHKLVEASPTAKPSTVALQEIVEKKVSFKVMKEEKGK